LLPHRSLDPDELEHAHAAWSVWRGMLPYKDFFEHHTPWYYYVLRPFFNWFDVDRSLDAATHFLVVGRVLSLVLTVVSVVLVWSIGRLWRGRSVGLLAAALLVSQPIFLQKTIEMRPDVPALAFFLGALLLLLRGVREDAEAVKRRCWFFVAGGLSLGAAVMFTQKMLFVLPGLLAGLGLWSLFGDGGAPAGAGRGVRWRILAALAFGLGLCLPGAATLAAFAYHHAGREFVTNNFLLNAQWKHFATKQFFKLIVTSWPILALGLLGAGAFLSRFFREGRRQYDGVLLLSVTVGLLLGVLVMPVPHRQYYLMPLPIVCLFAADGLLFLVDRAPERRRPALFNAALVLLAILPVVALWSSFRDRNDAQLAKLRTVFERTSPTDLVMDGWEGMGVFRPHAFYYYFLHEEAVAMLPPAKLDAYLDALERGEGRPKLIAMDKNLRTLGPRFLRFVEGRYTTSDGFFYFLAPSSRP
jgi:4-amino-4-deoxy-L-arabinose transferase-like glycosyltransferase